MIDKDKYIQKYKEIHYKKTGQNLSDIEASAQFEKLILLVSTVYQPIINNVYYEKYGDSIIEWRKI